MSEKLSCGFLLKQIHDEIAKRVNNDLRFHDMTFAQMNAINILMQATEKEMPLKQLERTLHVAQSTAAGIVTRLEQKGFVESYSTPDDKRLKIIRITPQGEECWLAAEKDRVRGDEALLSSLTDAEQEVLLILLKKVWESLK